MSKRILQLITTLNSGGAERIVYELATKSRNYQMAVAALDGRGVYAEKLRAHNLTVYDLGAYRRTDLGVMRRCRELLTSTAPQLLHTHLFHANIVGRLAARAVRQVGGIPVISTCHIPEMRFRPHHFWLDRLTAKYAHCEVCVSQSVAEFQQHKTGLPAEFFRIIPNGIDGNVFRPHVAAATTLRRELRLAQTLTLCGFLGRLVPQKGGDILLRAWRLLPPTVRQNCALVLAGYGRDEKFLRALARDLPQVYFIGEISQPEIFLAALEVCVIPSRYEGFGLVAAEAQNCGAAVAAANLPALAELITHGENGWLFPPENPAALAETLTQLLTNAALRQKLIAHGLRRHENLDGKKMLAAYEQLYATAIFPS